MNHTITKTLAVLTAAGTLGALALTSTAAEARTHFRGRVGVYIGAPIIAAPWYYSPYPRYAPYYDPYPYPYYQPAPVVVQEQPSVYIEQNPSAAPSGPPGPVSQAAPTAAPQAPAQSQYWYYCRDSQTYYPHVQNCGSPWQRVIPHAPQ
jgi:hypothetical protein